MNCPFFKSTLAAVALFAFLAPMAEAGDDEALREEVEALQAQYDALASNQQKLLEQEIESYLDEKGAFQAQGMEKGVEGLSLTGRFTAVSQSTLGLDPGNVSKVSGDVDLDFWFEVTENLSAFVYLTASATNRDDTTSVNDTPYIFGPFDFASYPNLPNGLPQPTFSGLFDGIGLDGTVPVKRGSITTREAGIQHGVPVGDSKLMWEIGLIDPRQRFLQNAFNNDENTQFLNNLFDDDPAISWLSSAAGLSYFGLHLWYSFGQDEMFTVNAGWFNVPGEFWNKGQLYVQFSWKGEISGREMNARITWVHDNFYNQFTGIGGSADNQWGVSWDWRVTDPIGVFFRAAGNSKDINVVKRNFSFGAIWEGPLGSRANDSAGLAIGYIKANSNTFVVLPKDTEWHVELYYMFALEDGKLQITPSIMWVRDPGGRIGYEDDSLWIFGVRFFVPF